ncbi:MAG: DUF1186 domain-containing protein, partial [Gemmatimonas sp.]|nr:DUF1186 domain-containing protein [Gemmatimonas sp.]
VMAAVFDGNPQPLYDVILAPEADEFVRSRMCEALAMVTLRGELPRVEAARFLQACYTDLQPQDECFVWNGWQSAIAMLGLTEMKPLVRQAFDRGFISPSWMALRHFEEDLERTIEDPARRLDPADGEYSLFGDTIEELSGWYAFSPEAEEKRQRASFDWSAPAEQKPTINPLKNVGRNDPCPCGSGKKFKKCCLK